jgi:integrase/recombinase XerD
MILEEYLSKKYSSKSLTTYLHRIKNYQKYNENHHKGTLQNVLKYLHILRNQEKHPKTLRNYLHSIKIYYDYLQYTGKRKDHPCKKLQLKDKIDKHIKVAELYSKKELETYLQETLTPKKLLVSFLVYQAVTASELASLKVHQIDIEKAEVTLKSRILPLEAKQISLLLKQFENKEQTAYLFTTKNNRKYQASELNDYINRSRLKVDKITPLKIRQSVIKNLLNTNDIRIVQVFAGHKTSSTTAQYKATNLEELKQQINTKHPLL